MHLTLALLILLLKAGDGTTTAGVFPDLVPANECMGIAGTYAFDDGSVTGDVPDLQKAALAGLLGTYLADDVQRENPEAITDVAEMTLSCQVVSDGFLERMGKAAGN